MDFWSKKQLVGPENTTSQIVVRSFQEKSGTTRLFQGNLGEGEGER